MPRLINRLDVREISLVGKPANKRQFAIVKMDTTPKEGMGMDEELRELFEALEASIVAEAYDQAKVDVANLREAVEERLASKDEEEEQKARRRPADEDEDYGYGKPKKRPKEKSLALAEKLADGLVQKSAFTDRSLTREQALAEVFRAHPGLYDDYRREVEAQARR